MGRKNYEIPGRIRAKAKVGPGESRHEQKSDDRTTGAAAESQSSPADPVDADVCLRHELGPDARIPTSVQTMKFGKWLSKGFDCWVVSAVEVLRALLRSGRSPATVVGYKPGVDQFFEFMASRLRIIDSAFAPAAGLEAQCVDRTGQTALRSALPRTPADLLPQHIDQFVAWLKKRRQDNGWTSSTARNYYNGAKALLVAMIEKGLTNGKPSEYFRKRAMPNEGSSTRHTSLSESEQARLSLAVKTDLSAVHHGRLRISQREIQILRYLVVDHRNGHNTMPLLELSRKALLPGLLPGTIRLRTSKHRNKRICTNAVRRGPDPSDEGAASAHDQKDLTFSLAEGAVIQQAISTTQHLVDIAPSAIKDRVWLYVITKNSRAAQAGQVSCLTYATLYQGIKRIVKRHGILGDDGKPLRLNPSRLRKSLFDRALRITDGDLGATANLLGNTLNVASTNYPSMNHARKVEAAEFMNKDYVDSMRLPQAKVATDASGSVATPVARCGDALEGEQAPRNGSPCDRFVMCLFCSSSAILGTVEDLWRLFSFQEFARSELMVLDAEFEERGVIDDYVDDLRNRYRLAIPFIDEFVSRKFADSIVSKARAKTDEGWHPFWVLQAKSSRHARANESERSESLHPQAAIDPSWDLSLGAKRNG